MGRPILLGMNNPLSPDPRHALAWWPDGCTGHRVLQLLQSVDRSIDGERYMEMFDRRNLVTGRAWSDRAAREEAEKFDTGDSDTVVVLGAKTWSALGMPETSWLASYATGDVFWWRVPHLSGLNHWYNVPRNRELAARLLHRIATGEK